MSDYIEKFSEILYLILLKCIKSKKIKSTEIILNPLSFGKMQGKK